MNKLDNNHLPVYNKSYSPKAAEDKANAQFRNSIERVNEGDINTGRKCMQEAIRIFREINEYYRFQYDNNEPKTYFELTSASQHIDKNNREIALIEKCMGLLATNLPFIQDVLNGYDLLPNFDPAYTVSWTEKRAHCRLNKCINSLKQHDLVNGVVYAEEAKKLLASAIQIHQSFGYPAHLDALTYASQRHIKTIDACLQLLKDPEKNLPLVIGVLKGETKLTASL